ncbi:unnamed protein product [Cercopithifilaria johnstoni]|uniref:Uncharacterized protein n=1 Tax=Cercopithifilaria johnstoni TaxID=2874296 RepID=A0A8J2LW78_9BILA|nr:unnamed protein product [Cercopithifilaria johnstoni]
MFFFSLTWAVINSSKRKTVLDIVLTILWSLTAFTYFVGLWAGYDDGDLIFAAKLRAQGLPVAAYNMREYFASINLEHESARQYNNGFAVAITPKKD